VKKCLLSLVLSLFHQNEESIMMIINAYIYPHCCYSITDNLENYFLLWFCSVYIRHIIFSVLYFLVFYQKALNCKKILISNE